MNFRSIAQLSDSLLRWAGDLPRDIDAVAGVPRSGLLAANLLALYRNLPLTDVDGLLHGRCYPSGARRRAQGAAGATESDETYLKQPRRILVLDDSVRTGKAMREARATIEAAKLPHTVFYAAVYVAAAARHEVDYFCELLNPPRVFEWNVFHVDRLRNFCISLEGVLRPALGGRDASPLIVPSARIGTVVTVRPEPDRPEIEAWLESHGYHYENLVCMPPPLNGSGPDAAAFKAHVYTRSESLLYIEDSLLESVRIARFTGAPVLCSSSMQLVHPGTMPLMRSDVLVDLHRATRPTLRESVTTFSRDVARRLLPPAARAAVKRRLQRSS